MYLLFVEEYTFRDINNINILREYYEKHKDEKQLCFDFFPRGYTEFDIAALLREALKNNCSILELLPEVYFENEKLYMDNMKKGYKL